MPAWWRSGDHRVADAMKQATLNAWRRRARSAPRRVPQFELRLPMAKCTDWMLSSSFVRCS